MGGEGYGALEEEFADENINYIPGIQKFNLHYFKFFLRSNAAEKLV